ncbi:Sulfur carrier protein CysO [Planctomycetes bacterium Pan216]|uniref:Sulfur carrier protein CysO n=1 Tax=Kolteria novifilia TaxID=2527975 RepID=A0A518B6N7_9BACT|nr:Sulfur carrier protein CysO [Planctomycetes bacterium Pan216]
MPTVTFELPSLLSIAIGEESEVPVEAETLAEAFEVLVTRRPTLQIHLFDESGDLRPHILCLHNDQNVRWLTGLDVPVAPGDVITIHQAVSGG